MILSDSQSGPVGLAPPKIDTPKAGDHVGAMFNVTVTGGSGNATDYTFYLITGVPEKPVSMVPGIDTVKGCCDRLLNCSLTATNVHNDTPGRFFLVLCASSNKDVLDSVLLYRD